MGVKLLAALAAPQRARDAGGYVQAQQREDGSFGDAQVTAWATLALVAAGAETGRRGRLSRPTAAGDAQTDVALVAMARAAAGDPPVDLLPRLRAHTPGKLVNATIWTILALRQAGDPAPRALVRALLAVQHRSGGWSWLRGGAPDSNDTAAAIQALRASGVGGKRIDRAVAFLRRHQNRDGGFELTVDRGSDAPSTAWAIQALLAAGVEPGAAAFAYLRRLQRPDGSVRYSARYDSSRLWTTAQVVPALARRPFPLR